MSIGMIVGIILATFVVGITLGYYLGVMISKDGGKQ